MWYTADEASGQVRVAGVVEANEVVVAATLSARLLELRVQEGDRVQAGQVIATLDRAQLEAERDRYEAAVNQLSAKLTQSLEVVDLESDRSAGRLAAAEAALAGAGLMQNEAEAALEQRRADAERSMRLAQQGLVSRQEAELRRTELRVAEEQVQTKRSAIASAQAEVMVARSGIRQVAVASADVERSRAELSQARAQLDEVNARLSQTILHAPLSGIVAVGVARQGEVIEAGRPIVTIVDDSDRWVRAAVDETMANRLKMGQPVEVELASGTRVTGTISQIAVHAEFATRRDVDSARRDVRTLGFKVSLPPDATAFAGLTAYVELPAEEGQ
jgi:HlyD family secretion protein